MAKQNRFANTLRNAANGEYLLRNLSYTAFLAVLGLVYIANAHFSEKTMRSIRNYEKALKEVRWQYLSIETDRMSNSKPSELIEDVRAYGLTMDRKRLKKIVVAK